MCDENNNRDLPSFHFNEPNQESHDDQRPLARYLRFLQRTNPVLEMKTMMMIESENGLDLPMAVAYLNPINWMCEMQHDTTFGNHLVADQDIEAESTLGCEQPIVYVTYDQDRCAECDRTLSGRLVRCDKHSHEEEAAACPLKFCSETCRDWAWTHYHKVQNPKHLGFAYEGDRDHQCFLDTLFAIKVMAMMLVPEENQFASKYIQSFLQNPHLLGLADKYAKSLIAGPGLESLKLAAGHAYQGNAEEEAELEALLAKLMALRHVYAFGRTDYTVLYGPSCLINHSCEPNVTPTGLQGHDRPGLVGIRPYHTIQALRPIQKGEQLFMDYREDSMKPRSTRKANLLAQYGFECQCQLCSDGTSRCDNEKCGKANVPLKRCGKCKSAVYCSRECQAKDWAHHKKFCGLMAASLKKD